MLIYITHAKGFDFKRELYVPIRESNLNQLHEIILPHEDGNAPYDSKNLIKKLCDGMLAEISYPSTGLGIELGWADDSRVRLGLLHKSTIDPSLSFSKISAYMIPYSNEKELIAGIEQFIIKRIPKPRKFRNTNFPG